MEFGECLTSLTQIRPHLVPAVDGQYGDSIGFDFALDPQVSSELLLVPVKQTTYAARGSVALWKSKLAVAVPLGVLCLVHWVVLWRGMFIIDAQYSPEAKACIVTNINHVLLVISFFTSAYTPHRNIHGGSNILGRNSDGCRFRCLVLFHCCTY